ncbi:MAG: ExbD/TolR family protein [Flavobacteriaceae bacterium]
MGNRRQHPSVNAGSMADIAFLLLIFFLVTTSIETETGMDRLLPREQENPPKADILERNNLALIINGEGELWVKDARTDKKELFGQAMAFLDNGGGERGTADHCGYCQGSGAPELSVHPDKAIITLKTDRRARYSDYITVQNELARAYNFLRDREAVRLYGVSYTELERRYSKSAPGHEKDEIAERITTVRKLFPQKIVELHFPAPSQPELDQ